MRRRGKISRSRSRKIFRGGAQRVHPRNAVPSRPMRGGIRL